MIQAIPGATANSTDTTSSFTTQQEEVSVVRSGSCNFKVMVACYPIGGCACFCTVLLSPKSYLTI